MTDKEKGVICAAILAVASGLEYVQECLATHETNLGRTTLKNKTWAETMEKDIYRMYHTLGMLRMCGANAELTGTKVDVGSARYDALLAALKSYRCQYTRDHDGDAVDLVDVLSPGKTIADGLCEMEILAEHLSLAMDESKNGIVDNG